jgi:hypothetical protein
MISADQQAQLDHLLERGQKIAAIKLYRSLAACDLKDAKDAMDRRESELRQLYPARFPVRRGCLNVVLLLAFPLVAFFALA